MDHARFVVTRMTVDGQDLPLRRADLVVVHQPGNETLDWECIATALDRAPLARGVHDLGLETAEGRTLAGPALLVRSVQGSHVLRGAGTLDGVDDRDLHG